VTLVISARHDASLLDLAYTFRRDVTAAGGKHAHLSVAGVDIIDDLEVPRS
jgi:hypothetical protein